MCKRLYKFFEDNKLIHYAQSESRQKQSTSHALIQWTEKIHEQHDSGNYGCEMFVDSQKAFDTVDHAFLTQKLEITKIIGFLHVIKTGHNSPLLMVLIQSLNKLTVVSPKGQY